MSAPKYPELFPIAIGNEEESMLQIGPDAQNMLDPIGFVSHFGDFLPSSVKKTEGARKFLQNGGLIYDGYASDDGIDSLESGVNLERATPECSTPLEVATFVQASEALYLEMLKNYVERRAKVGSPEIARAQRRTIDSYGNGRACHDSFESRRPGWLADFDRQDGAKPVLLTYLATRSFVTGAGYVSHDGVHFAQKVQHLTALNEYGFVNSAYRNASEEDTGARLEIRCNDINISPWATQVRVGGSALLFTLLQTPLAQTLNHFVPSDTTDSAFIANFQRYNRVSFDDDGTMQFSADIVRALDFQERTLELMDDGLGDFIEIPEAYQDIIWEMRNYCEDFRKVLHGDEQMALLADRSDVAAKFDRITQLNDRAWSNGIVRKIGDVMSMASDLRYDNITVDVRDDGKPRVTYGYGYKQRQNGNFRMTPKQEDVERAVYFPPQTTRAKTRGELIRRGEVENCEWSWFKHEGIDQKIRLTEVINRPDTQPNVTKN